MVVGKQRETELRKLYIEQDRSLAYISQKLQYESILNVLNDLYKFTIPVRPFDQAKITIDLQRRYKSKTNLRGSNFKTDGKEYISQSINIKGFDEFQLFVSLTKTGIPTLSTVQIIMQYAFSGEPDTWYNYDSDGFNFLVESEATIPRNFSIKGKAGGDMLRVRFVATQGTTLNNTNYFTLASVLLVFFGK